jgi:hypothetical protein
VAIAKPGSVLAPGSVTTVGSLPHVDADDAVRFVLAHPVDLPAAPQLPRRSPREGMVAQVAIAVPGVHVLADGSLDVDADRASRPAGPAAGGERLDPEAHGGVLAFLRERSGAGRSGPVKLQLAGPVTVGLAHIEAGLDVATAFRRSSAAVATTAAALLATTARYLPGVPLMVWLDEPGLVRGPDLPVDGEGVTRLLRDALDGLGRGVVTGVHCCGPADWAPVIEAGATVLSMPVDAGAPTPEAVAVALDGHLRAGGWIAWGAVPTDRPVGEHEVESLWQALVERWAALAGAGCDPAGLRRRALVSPACGLAGLDAVQAGLVVGLARRLGARVGRASSSAAA